MHWRVLGVCLAISVLLAFLLVEALLAFGFKEQLSLIVPLLPIFYAFVYPVIDRNASYTLPDAPSRPAPPTRTPLRPPLPPGARWSGRLGAVLWGLGASLGAYLLLELAAWVAYVRFAAEMPLPDWRGLSLGDLLNWFGGGLIALDGGWEVAYTVCEMIVVSAAGGVAIGLTSRGDPLLEGLVAGAIVSMGFGINQFFFAYEELSRRLGLGMSVLVLLQTFLFALWAGLVFRAVGRGTSVKSGGWGRI